ncbi:MAG: rod-binding protein [Campylobacterota bacterium]
MEINSNLINMSQIQNQKDFSNIKTKDLQEEQLRKVSDDFEAFFLKKIMDSSLKSVDVAGSSPGSDIIKGMYTDNISKSATGSLGISDMLYDFLSRNNK